MRQITKNYLAFTSPFYRLGVYLLIPAGLVGIGLWVGNRIGEVGVIFVVVLQPMAEVISDYWLFGGIQTKESAKLEYLKTSEKGMKMLKNALVLDVVRKCVAAAGTVLVCYLATEMWLIDRDEIDIAFSRRMISSAGGRQKAEILLYFVLVSYFASAAGTFLSRYGSMIWVNMAVGYGAMIFGILCMFLLGLSEYMFGINLLFGVMGVLMSMLTVRTAMKKVEESFYDS